MPHRSYELLGSDRPAIDLAVYSSNLSLSVLRFSKVRSLGQRRHFCILILAGIAQRPADMFPFPKTECMPMEGKKGGKGRDQSTSARAAGSSGNAVDGRRVERPARQQEQCRHQKFTCLVLSTMHGFPWATMSIVAPSEGVRTVHSWKEKKGRIHVWTRERKRERRRERSSAHVDDAPSRPFANAK